MDCWANMTSRKMRIYWHAQLVTHSDKLRKIVQTHLEVSSPSYSKPFSSLSSALRLSESSSEPRANFSYSFGFLNCPSIIPFSHNPDFPIRYSFQLLRTNLEMRPPSW